METLQIILLSSLVLLTLSASAVFIYFIFVLREVKETIGETKEMIRNGRKITTSVIAPITSIMGLLGGVKKGLDTIRSVTDLFNNEEDEYEEY